MTSKVEKKRTFKLSHNEEGFDVLTITETTPRVTKEPKKEVTHFALHKNPNADGAWDLVKLLDSGAVDVYNVMLDGESSTCTCHWGELRQGSTQAVKHCRHVLALLTIQGRGELPAS